MTGRWTARKFMGVVYLAGPSWSDEFPLDRLQGWMDFYLRMHKKYGHRTTSYNQAYRALSFIA